MSMNALQAGATCVDITPTQDVLERGVWIAGFGPNRRATGVHDPLSVRALVIEAEGKTVALAVADVVGLMYPDVQEIRRRCQESAPQLDLVWITATHNHEGPDTIGLWGPNPKTSGVDPAWLERVRSACVEAILSAFERRRPAHLRLGRTLAPGVCTDLREPWYVDEEMYCMEMAGDDGRAIGTVVNYANHPESLGSRNPYVSADYPHALRQRVEAERGGVCLYFTGALGGMTAPRPPCYLPDSDGHVRIRKGRAPVERSFLATAAMGEYLGERALVALQRARTESGPVAIHWQTRRLRLPVENPIYLGLQGHSLLPTNRFLVDDDGPYFETEAGILQIGRCSLAAIPGEMFPETGTLVKDRLPGEYTLLLGLANDEVGYLVPEVNPFSGLPEYIAPHADGTYGKPGHYEETHCVTPKAAQLVLETLWELADAVGRSTEHSAFEHLGGSSTHPPRRP